MNKNTSWGRAAEWYKKLLSEEGTYQRDLILPNLLRVLEIKKGETVLDLGCGPGFFAAEFARRGARVIGVDVSPAMVSVAEKNSPKEIMYRVAPSDKLGFIKTGSVDKVVLVLALQNIERLYETIVECARALKLGGKLFAVLSHPAFRVPKSSSWGWDVENKIQFRRIDEYMSDAKVKIQMHPGDAPDDFTLSFHRPFQVYFKALSKAGFAVDVLEEWISHKKSQSGPRARAEDKARKEIPLFLLLGAVKIGVRN